MPDGQMDVLALALERGSVAAAARELGISHQSAMRRIRGLEEEVGEDLFIRAPWGVLPTARGQALYDAIFGAQRADGSDPEPERPRGCAGKG